MASIAVVLNLVLVFGCGQEVKSVVTEPPQVEFKLLSQSEKLVVKATDIMDAPVKGVEFSFSTENPLVATVSDDGVVKPAGNGSTWITARTKAGIEGQTFVKICLPKAIQCEPADTLKLKVGLAAPIKCEVIDCKDEKRPGKIELTQADDKLLLKEEDNIFIGLAVGDTDVTIKAFDLETKVKVRIDEQEYLPGMEPGAGGGGGGGKKKGGEDSAYGKSNFDHILKNMNFGGN
ncbi:MAG TPA: hypothetical protein VM285_14610 [Polyangia bacterium]|nr:hypothetical protein [Polyangia bacterium]